MNQIAKEAGVTKLTIYNHFQDKETLFTSAIAETCEQSLNTRRVQLHADSNFIEDFSKLCQLNMDIVNLPEAIKLEHLLLELAAEQNPLVMPFYQASHQRLASVWYDFFRQAIQLGFIQEHAVQIQTQLLLSLLFGHRHHEVLLGVRPIPDQQESQQIIQHAIELFMLKYHQ